MYHIQYPSPLGILTLTSDGYALTELRLTAGPVMQINREIPVLTQAMLWLDRYFLGNPMLIQSFPLRLEGTPFQERVWDIVRRIPFGQVITYGQIADQLARDLGRPMSAQAVGGAVGRNPVPIIIPCHRVLGHNGKLTGYSGGLDKKIWLLQHEGHTV